jgi:hypothetical protein
VNSHLGAFGDRAGGSLDPANDVRMLALIAGTVSYLHMPLLAELHGQAAGG